VAYKLVDITAHALDLTVSLCDEHLSISVTQLIRLQPFCFRSLLELVLHLLMLIILTLKVGKIAVKFPYLLTENRNLVFSVS